MTTLDEAYKTRNLVSKLNRRLQEIADQLLHLEDNGLFLLLDYDFGSLDDEGIDKVYNNLRRDIERRHFFYLFEAAIRAGDIKINLNFKDDRLEGYKDVSLNYCYADVSDDNMSDEILLTLNKDDQRDFLKTLLTHYSKDIEEAVDGDYPRCLVDVTLTANRYGS